MTAGRDGAVKLWQLNFDKTCSSPIQEILSISEHEGFVNSVALLEGLSEHPEGTNNTHKWHAIYDFRDDCKWWWG